MVLGSEKGTLNDDTKWNGFDSKSQIGAHEIKAHKSITFIDGRSDTFYLQDDVVLDTTLGSDTVLGSADSSNTGTLKGDDVVIGYDNGTTSTSGSLSVTGGAWSTTQGQSITVADGSLTVSAQAGTEKNDGLDLEGTNNDPYYAGGVNTSLVINGGSFIIDKSTNGDNADVTVSGAKGATALLDLRNTSVTWGSGSVTITGDAVRDSKNDILSDAGEGQVFITGAQFKDFIDTTRAKDPSETKLLLGADGVLFADGTISGDIDVSTFVSGTTAANAGKVYFSGGGTFATNGQLSIKADDATKVLAIGAGTISAQSLTLTTNKIDPKDKGDLDKDIFTVSGGTLEVTNGLSSSNSVIEFKNDGTNAGKLILDTDDNTASGLISTNLRFNETAPTGGDYALDVEQGQWAMAEGKDAYFAGGANFKVGADTAEFELQGATAALSLDNLNVTGTSSNLVAEGGNLTVNTMQAGADATFEVQGQFTINGRSDIGCAVTRRMG